jgi:hypothetical protein
MGMAYEPPQTPAGDADNLPEEESIEPRSSRELAPGTPGLPSGAGAARKADPGDYGTLPRSYLNVLARSKPETYLAEMPNAGWGKTLLGVALVTLVSFGIKILLTSNTMAQVDEFKQSLARQGQDPTIEPWRTISQWWESSSSPLLALLVPLTFFGGAGLLYVLARAVRTKGVGEGASFMTHAYLLSLSYTPLHLISTVANVFSLVPVASCLAALISLGATLYQLYNAGVSMQASQKLEPGKAQMVAFVPWIVGIILSIVVIVFVAISLGSAFVGR